ncbi:uncharacterized protein [Rutidosis leptorrhynchoides]|uniref:uncharacterized protein n=1 Tax=Rutidosis leptorrhynchoides TaxID=125765 RepID=UPI003A99AAB1
MQVYWQSVFLLPSSIILETVALMRGFLWCQGEFKKRKANVKWSTVCLPKEEGGLGIKRFKDWNKALLTSLLWRILTAKQSFWLVIAQFLVLEVPADESVPKPNMCNVSDVIKWRDWNGDLREFLVNLAWNVLQPRADKVSWFRLVWFKHCIPHHSFVVWLLMGEKLKTQHKRKVWDVHSAQNIGNVPNKRKVNIIVSKILFGASIYFLWQERNSRLFKGKSRGAKALFEVIFYTSRLKIMSIKWKNSSQAFLVVQRRGMSLLLVCTSL